MEDLLKEEEFLPQKDSYNPWKGFVVFYIVAGIQFGLIFIVSHYLLNDLHPKAVTLLIIFMEMVTALCMIFYKKKIKALPLVTLSFAIAGLYCVYIIPLFVLVFLNRAGIEGSVLMFFLLQIISFMIIFFILVYKRKRL